jgi:acyl dehydratase
MIPTGIVGRSLRAHEARVTPRRMLAFAAGIGDLSTALFDDASEGFVAHPGLCVALEWPVVSDPETLAWSVPVAAERTRAVHLVQDSVFHQPLRAGDRVSTTGTVDGVWRGSSGVRSACTLRTIDAEGRARVSTRTIAVYLGVQADGDDRPAAEDPVLAVPALPAGAESLQIPIPIEPTLPHRYSECTGIWNPIHTERRAARAAGLPDIVVHGTATWALAGSALVGALGDGDATSLRRLRGRFGALVFPGSVLNLRARHHGDERGTHVHFSVHTPNGDAAIADGYALLCTAPGIAAGAR